MSRNRTTASPSKSTTNETSAPRSKAMRISAIGCIVFVGAIAFAALKLRPTPVPPPSIPSDADKIDFAIVETINAARASLLTDLKSGDAWGELGMRFMAHEFVDRAAICFEQAAVYSNHDARWPYLQARCVDQIDAQKGIELLRQSVALCGNQPSGPRLTLVELLLQQQQLDEAQRELDAFLLYAPTEPRARHAKARLLAIQGDFQACATEIEAINQRLQQQHMAMQSQYQELMKQGRQRQAAATRERANRMLGAGLAKQKSIGLLLANAYRNLGRADEAERQKRLAETQDDRGWPDPYRGEVRERQVGQKSLLVKADVLFGQGRYDESDTILTRIIAEYPDTLFGRIYLARSAIRRGRIAVDQNKDKAAARDHFERAQRILNETIAANPDAPEALFRLAVATAYLADVNKDKSLYGDAADIYREAIRVKSDFTMAYYNLANCLDRSGDLHGAIEAMRGAVRCEPNHTEANAILGVLLSKTDAKDEARKQLELALKLNPKHELARTTLLNLTNR